MKIYEYELEAIGTQNINIGGAMPTVLSVAEQNGKLVMWVQLEDGYPGSFSIDVDIVETGNLCETQGKFVGTAIMSCGLIWHVFAKINYIRADKLI